MDTLIFVGISSPPTQRGDNLATFQEWLKNNGVDSNVVEIAEFPGYGMGLKTKKDLQVHWFFVLYMYLMTKM